MPPPRSDGELQDTKAPNTRGDVTTPRTTEGGLKDSGVATAEVLGAPTPAALTAETRMRYLVLATKGANTTERNVDTPSL